MQVETFEQTETMAAGEEQENSAEAIQLIGSLHLAGQERMVNATGTRCPYREMTTKEERVYNALFPMQTALERYDSSLIPLRVLQVAAHAKDIGFYSDLFVWHEVNRPTDPLLVGRTREYKNHILARWGSALEPFEELYKKAVIQTMENFEVKAGTAIAHAKVVLENLRVSAIDHLNGGFVNI